MKTCKSEGVRRLSLIIGVLFVILFNFFCFYLLMTERRDIILLLFRIIGSMILFLCGWGIVRVIYWIYMGFKIDKLKNNQLTDDDTNK